ncbi:hypothetical protein BD410DRAFT_742528 [Rickenella mellea]|uniref:Plasma membrane fusion protein PRM1 n=1 Tax=Rickenella mellea TaxID=50990 RepID=A0A4Y7QGU0_9AGAM|nr:hypothetical protein BD410DRAFT_742528 [Rickenella mellea]
MSQNSPVSRWMTPPPIYDSHSTNLRPYLSLSHLLSLTWLAYPILSLLFVAFRLQLSSASAQDAVSDAKGNLLTSCSAAEKAATAAASMPRYMAAATNRQIAGAVNDTMNAARAALVLSLTIMETIINFIIDLYRSTFLCFVELVVRGGLSVLIAAVQEISNFIQSSLGSIRTNIQNDVAAANSAISSAVGALNKVNPFGNINVPQFSIPSLTALENVTIPTDFEDALVKLNASLPTIDQLKSAVTDFIDTPFELVKQEINETFLGLSFDSSVLPIPEQNTLSFCGQLDTSVVDDLGRDLLKAAKIGTVIIVIVVLLLIAANCCLEWYKWRCMHRHLEYTRQAWASDPTFSHHDTVKGVPSLRMTDHNLLILASSSSHPLLTRIANRLSALLRLSPAQHTNLQWFFHYVFHPPALACFLIGFFGLLSVQLQLLAVAPLEAKYSQQVASTVSDFSNTIATSVNASMFNQSSFYANDINGRVDAIQSSINNGLFGWVENTTTTLNDTLVTFYTDVQNAVSTVFNGTILESPVQEFVRCFIGSKVDAFEEALTFLHDNLQVNIPRVNESVLVLSQADVNEATQPIALAAVGGGQDGDGGLVGKLVNRYVEALKKERIMFGVFMALWGFVVLMALCILFYHTYGMRWLEARKKRKWQREQRGGIEGGLVVPYRLDRAASPPGMRGGMDEKGSDLASFTPTLKPKGGFFRNLMRSKSTSPPPSLSEIDPQGLISKPKLQDSWDSFLDSGVQGGSSQPQESVKPPKRATRKLTAIGRKVMGREILVTDEERARMDAAEANGDLSPSEPQSWLQKAISRVRKREEDSGDERGSVTSSGRDRPRPKLTISTDAIPRAELDRLPVVENGGSPQNVRSAWSMSPPAARNLPWLPHPSQFTAAKKVAISNPEPLRPKNRRNASVPQSIMSIYEQSPQIVDSPIHAPRIAIPLHHRQGPPTPHSATLPPSSFINLNAQAGQAHRRTSSVPFLPLNVETTPATRTLTTQAPQTPYSVDPFRTPFDDDAQPAPLRQSVIKATNPFTNEFAAIAI